MAKSTEELKGFLRGFYIHNPKMGSPHMSGAIRDGLTDIMHLCEEEGLDFGEQVEGAKEVYQEEIEDIPVL